MTSDQSVAGLQARISELEAFTSEEEDRLQDRVEKLEEDLLRAQVERDVANRQLEIALEQLKEAKSELYEISASEERMMEQGDLVDPLLPNVVAQARRIATRILKQCDEDEAQEKAWAARTPAEKEAHEKELNSNLERANRGSR